MNTNPGGVPS